MPTVRTTRASNRPACLSPAVIILAFLTIIPAFLAQGTGVVSGRIFNPTTGAYVRNAQIRIVETGQTAVSGDGGTYSISPVGPGDVTVEVTYTGYRTETAKARVITGQAAQIDFDLRSTLLPGAAEGDAIRLDRFVVASEREGNAKAIMEQRNSMNITNSVASDAFGDVAEGNVGEFLKHIPGVGLNLVDGVIRNVSLRGLGPEYTNVTLDGTSLASADANTGAAGNARAFAFEQVSLSSVESIEVSKTISADVDANAPAGTINLKTKRAFDRKGRRVTMQANATAHDSELSFNRTIGPDDHRSRKIRGGGIFEYSDVFLNNRLGVVFNISESNQYTETNRISLTYNTAPTAADSRAVVPTSLAFSKLPFTTRRSTITLSTDFKLTPELVLSLGVIRSDFATYAYIRNLTFNAANRTNFIGDNPLLNFTTSSAGVVTPSTSSIGKYGEGTTLTPKFEFKRGNLTVEGRFAISDSVSDYYPHKRGAFFNPGTVSAAGVTYTATRSDPLSADWQIRQVAGRDIADGANYSNGAITTDDGRYNKIELLSGDVSATYKSSIGGIPVTWKGGVKKAQDTRTFELTREAHLYTYTGPGAGLGAFRNYVSPYDYDMGSLGANFQSASGAPVYFAAMQDLYTLFREHPEYFTPTMSGTNYYNAFIANKKHYKEEIDAAFLMGTATLSRQLSLRAGVRWEETSGDSLEFDPLSPSAVAAAGYAVSGGRATSVDGVKYQYESKPRVHRKGSYDHLFPSASLKFRPWRTLDLQLGYSSTIRRPTFRDVAGVWTINEDALRVTAPNPNLQPEESDNFSVRAAYYFEPVGVFAISFFQNNVRGLHQTNLMTAEEFGYDGELDLSNYLFSTAVSSKDEVTVRGMELEYSQSLSFLPGAWRGLNVRASYTRNYASVVMTSMAPHAISAGAGYAFRGLNVSASLNWLDDQPTNTTNTAYVRHRVSMDLGASIRLNDRYSVSVSARNILDDPRRIMNRFSNGTAAVQTYDVYGTNYTLGLKAVF